MAPEVISALVLAIGGLVTGIITAIGICMRQTHMRHLKCCNAIEVDLASSKENSLDIEKQ